MPRVIYTQQAKNDLADILARIAEHDRPAARRMASAIRRRCLLIGRNPGMGRLRNDLYPGLRSTVVEVTYIIFSLARDRIDYILRILHGARDIDRSYFEDID